MFFKNILATFQRIIKRDQYLFSIELRNWDYYIIFYIYNSIFLFQNVLWNYLPDLGFWYYRILDTENEYGNSLPLDWHYNYLFANTAMALITICDDRKKQ